MKNLKKFESKSKQLSREEMKNIDGGLKWTGHRSCNVVAYGTTDSSLCCSLGFDGYTVTSLGNVCGYW